MTKGSKISLLIFVSVSAVLIVLPIIRERRLRAQSLTVSGQAVISGNFTISGFSSYAAQTGLNTVPFSFTPPPDSVDFWMIGKSN